MALHTDSAKRVLRAWAPASGRNQTSRGLAGKLHERAVAQPKRHYGNLQQCQLLPWGSCAATPPLPASADARPGRKIAGVTNCFGPGLTPSMGPIVLALKAVKSGACSFSPLPAIMSGQLVNGSPCTV